MLSVAPWAVASELVDRALRIEQSEGGLSH